jgi:hypothetical protein
MFSDTEDISKFSFFAEKIHLVNVNLKLTVLKEAQKKTDKVNANFEIELCKRVIARRTIRKCVRAIVNKPRAFLRGHLRPQLQGIGADLKILNID